MLPLQELKASQLQRKLRNVGYKYSSDFSSGSSWVQEIVLVLFEHCPRTSNSSHIPASPTGSRLNFKFPRKCGEVVLRLGQALCLPPCPDIGLGPISSQARNPS